MSLSNIAQRPTAISSSSIPVTGSPAPAEKEVKWLGRTVHEAKRTDYARLGAIIGAILIAIGLLLLNFMPLTATVIMGIGAFPAFSAFLAAREKNHLENALIHLVGSKEKIEKLPVVQITKNKEGIDEIKFATMKDDIARVTHKGKTYGIAFQYVSPLPQDNKKIFQWNKLYLFKEPFETSSTPYSDPWGNYSFSSHTLMSAKEGLAYEKMIKNKRFVID